jgi:hypothetical protein
MKEGTKFSILVAAFLLFHFVPIAVPIVVASLGAGLTLLQDEYLAHTFLSMTSYYL